MRQVHLGLLASQRQRALTALNIMALCYRRPRIGGAFRIPIAYAFSRGSRSPLSAVCLAELIANAWLFLGVVLDDAMLTHAWAFPDVAQDGAFYFRQEDAGASASATRPHRVDLADWKGVSGGAGKATFFLESSSQHDAEALKFKAESQSSSALWLRKLKEVLSLPRRSLASALFTNLTFVSIAQAHRRAFEEARDGRMQEVRREAAAEGAARRSEDLARAGSTHVAQRARIEDLQATLQRAVISRPFVSPALCKPCANLCTFPHAPDHPLCVSQRAEHTLLFDLLTRANAEMAEALGLTTEGTPPEAFPEKLGGLVRPFAGS